MKYTVVFDAAAESDLQEIYLYLLPEAGERIATRYIDGIIDYCESFETFPERGARLDHIFPACGLSALGERQQ